MNKLLMIVVLAVIVVGIVVAYAGSITGNGILDWFKSKWSPSLSPKKVVEAPTVRTPPTTIDYSMKIMGRDVQDTIAALNRRVFGVPVST